MLYNIIVGARPNFVKLSSFMREAKKHPKHQVRIIHTGQHYDDAMSKVFFRELDIPEPDIILQNSTLGSMAADIKTHIGFEPVIVFGDTRSALAAAIGRNGNHLIHIEAGLRSFDSRMPEETNRIVIDRLSDILFTTEESAEYNLKNEGFPEEKIKPVGNLMLETLEYFLPVISEAKGNHIVATIHRFENQQYLKRILSILSKIPDVILVIHPGTLEKINAIGLSLSGITTIPSMGYIDFMKLVYSSRGVITDSGGLQEETSYLGIPCATIRDNTERPSTLEWSNKLFPLRNLNVASIHEHLNNTFSPQPKCGPVAQRIFEYL
jgi:UDP-N-acetylglucosamine 2-epimerase (non-hydrolysing)